MRQLFFMFIAACFALAGLSCSQANAQSSEMAALRDSLDAIQFPVPKLPQRGKMKVVRISTQTQWNKVDSILLNELKSGVRNVEIRVCGRNIEFGKVRKEIINWKYPNANIRIVGKCAKMQPYGRTYSRCDKRAKKEGELYSLECLEFSLNDMVVDANGNEIPMREDVKLVKGDIVKVQEFKDSKDQDVWKFQVDDLPNLTETQCKDFYVLMTRDWTSARHKVIKVQDGWLYYLLDSEDLHSDRNPNVDWIQYRVRTRYRLINSPVSKGVHIVNGRIYIPKKYRSVRVNKGGQLITFAYCNFNSLEITGFELNGCGSGYAAIGLYSSFFREGAFIHDNSFCNMSLMAISTALNTNVVISNNTINSTRQQAIEGGGKNTTIVGNYLKNIGWMLNTRAITGGGEQMHICDNVIEDFNYSAIACGSTAANDKAKRLTYIIERNTVKLNDDYTRNYIENTLSDGGGIYTGPQCTWGIIRNNVVENIKGIHSNRGIFLDDGCKNLAIYGNMIMNTANCYDIDLRYSTGYAKGIPDHNTNNYVFQNIMTGGYRFQDAGAESNCVGGENILISSGPSQKTVVELKRYVADVKVDGASAENAMKVVPVDGFVKKQIRKKK